MADKDRTHVTVHGDQINQEVSGSGTAIGKIVESKPDLDEALRELRDLIRHLRDRGLIDEDGEAPDEEAQRGEIAEHRSRFRRLFAAVRGGSGPTLQNAIGSTIAGAVVTTVSRLVT